MLLMTSCVSEEEKLTRNYLSCVDTLIDKDPHKADSILDIISPFVKDMPEDVQMKWRLYDVHLRGKFDREMPESQDFFDVVEYYDNNGTPNERMRAHLMLGYIYYNENDAPAALESFYSGIECADTLSPDCDYRTLMCLWGHTAIVYRLQHLPEEEIKARKINIYYSKKAGLIEEELYSTSRLVYPYLQLKDTNMVLKQTEIAADLYRKHNFPHKVAGVYPFAIYVYLNRGQYDKAYKYIKMIEETSDMFDENHKITLNREHFNYALGLYQLGVHNLDKAEYHFRELLRYKYYVDGYNGLFRLYQEKHNVDSIIKYSDLYVKAADKRISYINAEAVTNVSSKYEYSKYVADANLAKEQKEKTKYGFIALICLCFLVYIIGIYIYRKRNKRQIAELNSNLEDTERKTGIVEKENDALRSKLDSYKSISDETQLMNSDFIIKLRESKCFMRENEWLQMENLITKHLPMFCKIIEGNVLSMLEKRLCMLTRLGFSSSEISSIMNLSSSSVSNKKTSINSKLFGIHSASGLLENLKHREKEMS